MRRAAQRLAGMSTGVISALGRRNIELSGATAHPMSGFGLAPQAGAAGRVGLLGINKRGVAKQDETRNLGAAGP